MEWGGVVFEEGGKELLPLLFSLRYCPLTLLSLVLLALAFSCVVWLLQNVDWIGKRMYDSYDEMTSANHRINTRRYVQTSLSSTG